MIRIDRQVQGPHTIRDDTICYGQITGGATINSGVRFILYGMITGDVIVEAGAIVEIYGMVNGSVRNKGGQVTIYGCVDEVEDYEDVETKVEKNAIIRGAWGGPLL